jgi:hypothetical protein
MVLLAGPAVSLRDASRALWSQFHEQPWFIAVGEGVAADKRSCLVLYVKNTSRSLSESFSKGWMGYEVILREVGSVGATGPVG